MKKTMIVFAGMAALAGLDLVAPARAGGAGPGARHHAAKEPPSSRRRRAREPPAVLVESFDGLGVGFEGPQGTSDGRNPSDNSLAVGPDHIVQTVNSRMAIFTKKGARYDTTGKVLYGPVDDQHVFAGLRRPCEARNNGDAVVRYDQLADRWLIVMPIFRAHPAGGRSRRGDRR